MSSYIVLNSSCVVLTTYFFLDGGLLSHLPLFLSLLGFDGPRLGPDSWLSGSASLMSGMPNVADLAISTVGVSSEFNESIRRGRLIVLPVPIDLSVF